MKWVVFALLALILAWVFVPDFPQENVTRPSAITKAPAQISPPLARAGDVPAQRVGQVSAQTCEVVATQGAHMALSVEDARSGAAEDIRDVCPSNVVTQVLEKCSEQQVQNAEGVMERQYRCVQSGSCRICGEDLVRRHELLDERKK